LKIDVNLSSNFLLSIGAAFSATLFVSHVTIAYGGINSVLDCAQSYPDDNDERLKCYDNLLVPDSASASEPPNNVKPDKKVASDSIPVDVQAIVPAIVKERSYLTKAWNLDDLSNRDPSKLGRLQPYRQNYLIVKKTSSPNRMPDSPLIDHNVTTPNDIDAVETKFQLSFKADIGDQRNVNFWGIRTFRMWGAYTQQSDWQMFNTRNSSPFRETVYEPELIATLGTGHASGLKLINLGWVHQSNGRPLPESRSWNRIYLLGGWEWNDVTSIMARGWWRIPEDPVKDDNPDISKYLGYADMVIRWEPIDKSQAAALLLRDNLSRSDNRGYVQLDWATPVRFGQAARMHIQISSGYGESLIDYNHSQNTIGLGFSFREW
jgi:phospholipase A1